MTLVERNPNEWKCELEYIPTKPTFLYTLYILSYPIKCMYKVGKIVGILIPQFFSTCFPSKPASSNASYFSTLILLEQWLCYATSSQSRRRDRSMTSK